MAESGNWLTPTYNGENRYDKPILFYWLMAASYRVFGVNEFGARFPSALSGFLLGLVILLFVRSFDGERKALYAAFSFTLSIYFLVYSHAAVTDMALTLFITLSLFCFFLSLGRDKRAGRYLYGFYLFSALAFLTKGLVGVLFPFGIALVYLLIIDGVKGPRRALSMKGFILFLLVSAPWYLAQLAINGREFFEQFFIKHHFRRYTGVISGHRGPFYYYLPVLFIGMLPWITFLPGGIKSAFRDAGKSVSGSNNSTEGGSSLSVQSPSIDLFAFVWLVFIVLFFSLSTTKLPNYVLPAVPAASILTGAGMAREDRWRSYAYAVIAVMTFSGGIVFLASPKYLVRLGVTDAAWIYGAAAVFFAQAIVGFYAFVSRKALYGTTAVLVGMFLLLLSVKAMPLVGQNLQGTLHKYSLYAKERLGAGEKIISYGINNPSIVFYSGHRVVRIGRVDELLPLLGGRGRILMIAKAKETEGLSRLGFAVLEEDGKYAILERQ